MAKRRVSRRRRTRNVRGHVSAREQLEIVGIFSEILAGTIAAISFVLRGQGLASVSLATLQTPLGSLDLPTLLLVIAALIAVVGTFALRRPR